MATTADIKNSEQKLPAKYYLEQLPDKLLFLAALIPWIALFHFWGNSTFGWVKTASMFGWMKFNYLNSVDDQHCAFIPLVVLVLLWWKRDELAPVVKKMWWPAFGIILFAAALHLLGFMIQQMRLSILGFFLGIYGLTGLIWGREWMKRTAFPMMLLVFCLPVGGSADVLTLPLRKAVTKISVGIGNGLLGINVFQNGSQICDGSGAALYDVAPACSGIRSLISLFLITIIYSFMSFQSNWRRLVMVLMAIPLAIIGNVARITTVIIVGDAISHEAGTMIEQKFGFLTFAVAIGCIFLVGYLLREKRQPVKPIPAEIQEAVTT